jgi:hypothetical protein
VPLPTVSPDQSSADTSAETGKIETVLRARQELLDHVSAGEDSIPSVLARAETDPVVATTKVSQLVQALPGYGPGKAVGALKRAGIAVDRRVEGLEPGQHTALLEALA